MTEAALHKQVAAFLARTLPENAPWTTIGHGGGGKARGARLKAMGLQPGWPDIIILFHGRFLGIELKAEKGRLSPEQVIAHQRITLAGGVVRVARTLKEVEDFLIVVGIGVRGRIAA